MKYDVVATTRSGWNGAETVRIVACNLTRREADRECTEYQRSRYRDTTFSVEQAEVSIQKAGLNGSLDLLGTR